VPAALKTAAVTPVLKKKQKS